MKKLYYENPYIKTFETELVYQAADDKERVYAVLKETAFYPTGGGQPHDEGTLNGIKVVDVEEAEGKSVII